MEDILKKLNKKFGKESRFEARRGKVLEYLGITLDYRERGKVKFAMYEYIIKLLEELPPDIQGTAKTSVTNFLFNTNPESKKLIEEQGQLCHHLVNYYTLANVGDRIYKQQWNFYTLE